MFGFILLLQVLVGVDVAMDAQLDPGSPMKATGAQNDRWIVLTTIQAPTEAVRALARIPGWSMVVIGDEKTPAKWR